MRLGERNIRGRSCALINDTILVDFPPDILSYKVRYDIDMAKVSHVFITHSHLDHLAAGEFCYYHRMYANRNDEDSVLNIYGNEKVLQVINDAFVFDMGHCPDCISLNRLDAFGTVDANSVHVTAIPVEHDKREDCFIYLFESNGRILIANDSAYFTETTFQYLAGLYLDAVILDCTGGKRYPVKGFTHMTFTENLVVKSRLESQKSTDERTLFLSHHFSHNGLVNYDDFMLLAEDTGFVSTYDGMEINVGGGVS